MSGIRTGTRLEQIEALRRRVTVQLEYARRRGQPTDQLTALADRLDAEIQTEQASKQAQRRRPERSTEYMAQLGVTPAVVRRWALDHGIQLGQRGRIPYTVVQAYADHQQLAELLATGYVRRKETQ